jgi:hypothetical protein
MKKLIVLSIALLVAMALALPANAANGLNWEANDPTSMLVTLGSGSNDARPANVYGLSNNVYLYYATDTEHMNYVLGSAHKSGNRGYGSANSTTLIYYQTKNTGDTSVTISVTPATDASFGSGWTAL